MVQYKTAVPLVLVSLSWQCRDVRADRQEMPSHPENMYLNRP